LGRYMSLGVSFRF